MSILIPDTFVNKKWLINESTQIVEQSLLALVKCNPHLALLDCGKVVVRRDHLSLDKVKIISGGASGHEPLFSGFVGQGMLTASVQGGIYLSPSPGLVLKTLKELARRHDKGLLVIISSNMSDSLSFGLAVERIKNVPNVNIRFLKVSDDCNTSFDRRGLAGTILIQKIAGAMAELDFFLFEIHLFCKELLKNMATILISLKPAVSPFFEISVCARTERKDIEFGAGLHGQPGYQQIEMISSKQCVEEILEVISDEKMSSHVNLNPESRVVVLVNNFGHSTKVEEMIFVNEIVTQLQEKKVVIERIYTGSFISSIEMCGFSLTILNVENNDILSYLDFPTDAPSWKSYTNIVINPETNITLSTKVPAQEMQLKPNRGPMIHENTVKIFEQCIHFACGAIISCEKQLNLIDSESGDADTGTNMKSPCSAIIEYLLKGKFNVQWPFMLFHEISKLLENHFGGLMSCFYSILFEAAAQPLFTMTESDEITINVWAQILESATQAMKKYGGCVEGQLTMLDALSAATASLQDSLYSEMTPLDAVGLAACAAEDAAVRTRRARALHPDPGAHAFGVVFRAIYEALKLHYAEKIEEKA